LWQIAIAARTSDWVPEITAKGQPKGEIVLSESKDWILVAVSAAAAVQYVINSPVALLHCYVA
jgi:hypothetical protein